MSNKPVLYGFNGSTYVRSVRMMLREKGLDYDQVPVNVLEGEPQSEEHRARHPFGKVPVLDIDGVRLLETDAILRYLDETAPGRSFVPANPLDRPRMSMAMSLINSYGYDALIGAAGYHLFPDFLGNPSEEDHEQALAESEKLMALLMEKKGADAWLAGGEPSLADMLLGPIVFYVSLTPDMERITAIPGVSAWWEAMQEFPSFKATEPELD